MNFEEWLEKNQYDIDFGDDTIDLMKTAYVAGLREAIQAIIDCDMYGNEAAVRIKRTIGESE